jgi:hypothetical protein
MLHGLTPYLPIPPPDKRPFRHQVHTKYVACSAQRHCLAVDDGGNRKPESSIAPYLAELQKRVKGEGVRVGSYPLLMRGVTISLIGPDETRVRELGQEVRLYSPDRTPPAEHSRHVAIRLSKKWTGKLWTMLVKLLNK